MFLCHLCEEQTVITSNLCASCRRIKHMMSCYSREIVYDVLEKVLIRDSQQREYKIKNYKKPETDIIDNNDSSYRELKDKTNEEIKKKVLDKFGKK
jgi:hypothetical protein|tara:strand:+ start:461 stop:748 length:288 start_codon:yes stop_codon:yes gene_type:complete